MKSLTFVEIDVPSWVPQSPEVRQTWRFAIPTDYLPQNFDAIPSIRSVDVSPQVISLGEDLGERASITVTFEDHRHQFAGEAWTRGTFWGKWRGRFGTKLRGRELRIIRGALGDPLAAMETRHYVIDTTDGPTPQGIYTVTAKDVLKFADDERSQLPVVSNGSLAGSIDAAATNAILSPSGIGNLEYPSSGWLCLGGNEIISFTRVGDGLTMARGQLGSIASAHDAGERAQRVINYTGNDVALIVQNLLVVGAGVDPTMIPLGEWQAETAAHIGITYARVISEPTSVATLLAELVKQTQISLYWDDLARLVRLKAIREIATDAEIFDYERIIEGTLQVREQPGKRSSQIWTYYVQRDPTDQSDEADNYANMLADVELQRQGEYGGPEITKVFGNWLATINGAQRLNQIWLTRFQDPPRKFAFSLHPDQVVDLAQGYQMRWPFSQDATGLEIPVPIQITRIRREADAIHIEAEEMLASGVVVLTHTVILISPVGANAAWTVPGNWNDANNSIHCIGGGGAGGYDGPEGGSGGGGGAYSRIVNWDLTPGASVTYRVGAGGAGQTFSDGAPGGDTWFGAASFEAAFVGARGGQQGRSWIFGNGGAAASGIGTLRTSGGNGGAGARRGSTRAGGGGGGGAGGPNGNGGHGGDNTTVGTGADGGSGGGGADGGANGVPSGVADGNGQIGGAGGNNRFNFGGGNATQPNGQQGGGGRGGNSYTTTGPMGGTGGTGSPEWTQTVPPIISVGPGGGGGGGGAYMNDSRNGGLYGGGGGGSCGSDQSVIGSGAQGVIIIQWKDA